MNLEDYQTPEKVFVLNFKKIKRVGTKNESPKFNSTRDVVKQENSPCTAKADANVRLKNSLSRVICPRVYGGKSSKGFFLPNFTGG